MTLTKEEYNIMFKGGTEQAFSGKLLHNKKNGKYYCKNCGNEIFSSKDKFDSGTGWPSFKEAIYVKLKEDNSHNMNKTEVICAKCGGHLGHFFKDDPYNARYCINSVALKFNDKDQLF